MKEKFIRVSEKAHSDAKESAEELTKKGCSTDIGEFTAMAISYWRERNSTTPCPTCGGIVSRILFTNDFECSGCGVAVKAVPA